MSLATAVHTLLARKGGISNTLDESEAALRLEAFSEEVKCYNLPYGILGFVSHVLTYYTILCLWLGRKPFWPFSRVKFSRFDLALGGVGLLVSTLLSIVTIVRCKDNWELTVIAVWKLGMSLLNGATAIHVAILYILEEIRLRREEKKAKRREASDDSAATVIGEKEEAKAEGDKDKDKKKVEPKDLEGQAKPGKKEKKKKETPISIIIDPLKGKWIVWWIILYIPSMLAGVAGLMALVVRLKAASHPGVRGLTAGFYTIVGVGVLSVVAGIAFLILRRDSLGDGAARAKKLVIGGLVWVVVSFSVLAVFYSDWVLGVMTKNLTGLPSADNSALFWTYWIAKRLPMFSL
ncbi:hypothetical protein BKA70DRAFT_92241 [Coprinopsis sp. MPI-PUGE-AT-0042]|nr:hypothetical protein BKA70DRAFT_92241 [Coprinopsis sp. MPI-PUGE-AT-0042]